MDREFEILLDLDGTILVQTDAGHWALVRAKRVKESRERPHGISYSLTFHGPDNRRILGYDNAHGHRSGSFHSIIATGTPTTKAYPTSSVPQSNC